MKFTTVLLAGAMLAAGCATAEQAEDDWAAARIGIGTADEGGLLAFVNDPGTTFDRLDLDCAIRRDSAHNILHHRDGRDRTAGTADDNPFDMVAELDAVSMVGEWTLERLYGCAADFGFVELDPGVCVPTPFEAGEDDLYEAVEHWSVGELPAALVPMVDVVLADAMRFAHPERDLSVYPFFFVEAKTFLEGGQTVGYEIRVAQTIDPECGIRIYVRYRLDTCLQIQSVYSYI